jgi:hypothetical protein
MALAQIPDIGEDDLTVGGDIFEDYNEDIEAAQVMEDERYYRYGRFFSFELSVGLTSFDGNRGSVYEADPPSYGIAVHYFMDFRSSFGMGLLFSKQHFFIDTSTLTFDNPPGLIDVSLMSFYFSYRYYIDTSNLGTAITYSNPYFVGRIEYWLLTNKFIDQEEIGDDTGGGLGFGAGFGLEFPIKLKESYVGVEVLYHSVNYPDKFTQILRAPANGENEGIVDDLTGNTYTIMVSYVFNW